MASPNPDPSERDFSFPVPYQFEPKPGETPKAISGKALRWRKVLEDIWKTIYRHALTAGLTTTEAEQIAKTALLLAARDWYQHRQQMTGEHKGWVLRFAQQRIAEMILSKRNPKPPNPADVSRAWREKYDSAHLR